MEDQQGGVMPSIWAILKHFDPFAILEPTKIETKTNNQSDNKSECFGSLLTVKKDADVLDVFDNLFVTPQQVACNESRYYDKELTEFLDKYEDQKVSNLIDIPDYTEKPKMCFRPDNDIIVSEPKLELIDDSSANDDLIDNLIAEKSIESLVNDETNVEFTSKDPISFIRRNEIENYNIYHETPLKDSVQSKIQVSDNKLPNNVLNMKPIPKTFTKETTPKFITHKVFIETVSKDPKVFQKRRIVKPEKEIIKFTKGADLNEKRIVLPQIMERLEKRKFECDIKKSLPKKLILDTGKSATTSNDSKSVKENISPRDIRPKEMKEYLNPQKHCNINMNLRSDDSKNNPSTSKNVKANKNNEKCSCLKTSINLAPDTSIKELERQILLALVTKTIDGTKLNGADGESPNVKKVTLSPKVLMGDCNRERLIEFERRRLFERFVRNGRI